MSAPRLSFRSVEIRRMPGFPRGGLTVEGLCPGVNIVYGPNASGKTTLGRAVHRILRPHEDSRHGESVAAVADVNGTPLRLEIDFGQIACQRLEDGSRTAYPKLAPAELRDRYILALHDLLRSEEDQDLAREILRELAGGYDVERVREALRFRDRPSGKGSATRDLEQARKEYSEAQKKQDSLREEQAKLDRLEAELQQAAQAQARLELLEWAQQYLDKQDEAAGLRRQFDSFPEGVGRLTEYDLKELDAQRQLLETARERQRKEDRGLRGARRLIENSPLSEAGVSSEIVGELRRKCQRLHSLRDDIHSKRQRLKEAVTKRDEAQQVLGPGVTAEQAEQLDTGTVRDLFEFARRAEGLRHEQSGAEKLHAWVGPAEATGDADPQVFHDGAVLLQRWLAERQAETQHPKIVVGAGIATLLLGVVMAFLAHLSWLLLLIVGAGLLIWALWLQWSAGSTSEIQREYTSLGIEPPKRWSPETVRAEVRTLQKRHGKAAVNQEKVLRWPNLEERLRDLTQQQEQFDEERSQWAERLGVDPTMYEEGLYLLASNIRALQEAQREYQGLRAALGEVTEEYDCLLREIVELLEGYGFERAADPESVAAQVEELDRRRQEHDEARRTVERSTRSLQEEIEPQIQEAKNGIQTLFTRAGLDESEEHTLREWVRLRPEYDSLQDKLRIAEHDLENLRTSLAEQPDLMERSREELVAEREECRGLAGRLDAIKDEIRDIEIAVKNAKEGTDLEAKLDRRYACEGILREQRQRDCDALVGNALTDYISEQQRQVEMPGMLRRARELFARITHGRYELHVEQGDPPQFRAFETARQVGLGLDELSSGTRLQLLLAVRIAFVEHQEQDLKVPLILDETLGNSDERRASEIIDAAVEICRDGRQVFYFTAQHDEVSKWQRLLRERDQVPHTLIDLAEVRRFSEAERVPPVEYEPARTDPIPSAEGLGWLEYGRRLAVPGIDPFTEAGDLHLWYLVDDLSVLHRLLTNGINKWGQLQTLVSYGRVEGVAPNSDVYRSAEAVAKVIELALQKRRIGRGKSVNCQVLLDSGAVSETFVEAVAQLTGTLQGDARALIAALEEGQVKGFRTGKCNELREYLVEKGYLDENGPLSPEEIREQVRVVAYPHLEQGLITPERFEHLVALAIG